MTDTLILGGGLAGTAAALWLADQGRSVTIADVALASEVGLFRVPGAMRALWNMAAAGSGRINP